MKKNKKALELVNTDKPILKLIQGGREHQEPTPKHQRLTWHLKLVDEDYDLDLERELYEFHREYMDLCNNGELP